MDAEYNRTYLDQLTASIDQEKRRSLIRWWAGESEAIKIEILRRQSEVVARLRRKQTKEDRAEFFFACLVWAVSEVRSLLEAPHQKKRLSQAQVADLDRLALMRARKIKAKKSAPKKSLLDRKYYLLIKKLRDEEKLSWRDCAEYMKKNRKVSVSWSHLRRAFLEIERERELAGKG
ncbi:MAG: hypothetical protein WCO89_03795 [Syntrophus sp. (in: bacteria)]